MIFCRESHCFRVNFGSSKKPFVSKFSRFACLYDDCSREGPVLQMGVLSYDRFFYVAVSLSQLLFFLELGVVCFMRDFLDCGFTVRVRLTRDMTVSSHL